MTSLEQLLHLSHELGREERAFAILGEGNTSCLLDDETFLVKASGSSLAQLGADDVVRVSHKAVTRYVSQNGLSEEDIESALVDCLCEPGQKKPSVETFMHAVCLQQPGVSWVGHTHTTSVLSILASKHGAKPFMQHLCPDVIVVCGLYPLALPYINPGLELAQVLQEKLQQYYRNYNKAPKVILLENHGPVALGSTANEVLQIMLMLDKWAKLIINGLNLGGLQYLSDEQAQKIDSRLDEHYRRKQLNGIHSTLSTQT